MSDPQSCWDELRALAEKGSADPGKAAGQIVTKYRTAAKRSDFVLLRRRLEDTLVAGQYTTVPLTDLDHHARWLTVLAVAIAAAKEKRA
jgi:hypothetical protein